MVAILKHSNERLTTLPWLTMAQFDCLGVIVIGALSVEYADYGWRAARSRHTGGVNMTMADGSVHFVADAIDMSIWQAISMRAGNGSAVSLP